MAREELRVPDLEGAENVGVVEVYVAAGDTLELDTPVISLESDKAVMDVPSTLAGRIVELKVSQGDTVNAGDLIAYVETASESAAVDRTPVTAVSAGPRAAEETGVETAQPGGILEVRVPDLQGSADVAIVEVYVAAGDTVQVDSPLISLESEKAVMDVPSPFAGTVTEILVKVGDTMNTGDPIAKIRSTDAQPPVRAGNRVPAAASKDVSPETADSRSATAENSRPHPASGAAAGEGTTPLVPGGAPVPDGPNTGTAGAAGGREAPVNRQTFAAVHHATPSVRALAREMGVDLGRVTGSGPKGRITREDVASLVKSVLSGLASAVPSVPGGAGFVLPPIPAADFAVYGPVETVALSRIKKISGPHLHRNWIGVPHVTQFEDADITDLEEFRKSLNEEAIRSGAPKVSPLIFIIKAVTRALKDFPDFNSSLSPDGASLIRKAYIHIGIAVDTPGGLMVPVIRDADRKGIREMAGELADLSTRAREGKLKPDELKGGTFSISSLGGIGGTYFTPIVNAPEVAILGLSRSAIRPVWNGREFLPRLILPFSVSYDHRVIDGAQGARFAVHLAKIIGDMRWALL